MILVLVSTPLSVARAGLSQKQAEKTIRWLYALSINASRKNAHEYAQCHQVRIPCCHQGIHDWFWAKLVIEELSVLKSTHTYVNLQWETNTAYWPSKLSKNDDNNHEISPYVFKYLKSVYPKSILKVC